MSIDRFWLKIYFILYEPYQLSNFEQLENRNTDRPHFPKKINESNTLKKLISSATLYISTFDFLKILKIISK